MHSGDLPVNRAAAKCELTCTAHAVVREATRDRPMPTAAAVVFQNSIPPGRVSPPGEFGAVQSATVKTCDRARTGLARSDYLTSNMRTGRGQKGTRQP